MFCRDSRQKINEEEKECLNKINKIIRLVYIVLIAIILLCSCGPKNGLIKEKGETYYYLNGEMQFGWQKIDDDYYYFGSPADGVPSGAMLKNYLVGEWDGPTYGLGDDGKMLKNQFANFDDRRLYFGADGAMATNTQKEIGGKVYKFDDLGNAEALPDYQLVFNCTFPNTFRTEVYGIYNGDIIIESVECKYDSKKEGFQIYLSGIAGVSYRGTNYAAPRSINYRLLDPDGYVIESSFIGTNELKMGEKFKEDTTIGRGKIVKKGVYKLELPNPYYK